jgi:hypothetical protein
MNEEGQSGWIGNILTRNGNWGWLDPTQSNSPQPLLSLSLPVEEREREREREPQVYAKFLW